MTTGALPRHWEAVLGPWAPEPMRHPLDASAWRYTGHGLNLLFDAGTGLGPRPRPPDLLFLTHGHADHSGGAARLGVPVHAGEMTVDWLRSGDETRISLELAIAAGVYPHEYRWTAPTDLRPVADRGTVTFGAVSVTAIATPGHSADHTCWLVESPGCRILVGGDVMFAGGTIVLQNTWDSLVRASSQSIREIVACNPDVILTGHGPPLVGALLAEAFEAASARLARMLPPALFL